MDDILLDFIPLLAEDSWEDPASAPSVPEMNVQINRDEYDTHFLKFVYLIFVTRIPIFSPIVLNTRQALASTAGPLIEVPVLVACTYAIKYMKRRLKWEG